MKTDSRRERSASRAGRSISSIDPDIEIENCAVQITQYINHEGAMIYKIVKRGDVPISTFIGLMEVAKYIFLEDHNNASKDDE